MGVAGSRSFEQPDGDSLGIAELAEAQRIEPLDRIGRRDIDLIDTQLLDLPVEILDPQYQRCRSGTFRIVEHLE